MFLKAVVWVLGVGPALWMGVGFFSDGLGANPVEALLHLAGRWALTLLLLTLTVTPLRRLTGWNRVVRVRRLLGLFSFFYASLHLMIYLGLDQGFAWEYLWEDVVERPFITVGLVAFLLLFPLAVTSTRRWIRRLGKNWQRLHRFSYLAAGMGVVHFYWKVKADTFWPLVAGGVLVILLVLRVPGVVSRLRKRS